MPSTDQRHTVNLDERDARLIAPFLEPGSPEQQELERLVGEPLNSTSATLRALARLGAKRVSGELLTQQYNDAVAAGAFSDPESLAAEEGRRLRRAERARRRAELEDSGAW